MRPHGTASPTSPVHLRPRQIVERHGVSERTVRRWIADGMVDVIRVNGAVFVTVESLDRLFRDDK